MIYFPLLVKQGGIFFQLKKATKINTKQDLYGVLLDYDSRKWALLEWVVKIFSYLCGILKIIGVAFEDIYISFIIKDLV